MKNYIEWLAVSVLLCSAIASADEAKSAHPAPDEAVWSRVDKLNAGLEKAPRPLPGKDFAEALQEARALLRLKTFEDNYQEIRAWAFASDNDFSYPESLAKRAAPALAIDYGGDFDREQISYSYFCSQVAPGSEPDEFLKAYPRYSNLLTTLNPAPEADCQFPFDFPGGAEIKKAKIERPKAIAQWKSFQEKWKEPMLARFAAQAARCLAPAK